MSRALEPAAGLLPPERVNRWRTTPAHLRMLIGATWVLVTILGALIASSANQHRRAVHDIAVDAAPSVASAHRIKVEIESLDADIVNEMLVPPDQAKVWSADFEVNRVEIGRQLLAATRSAYGEEEDAPIEKLEDSLGRYLMAAQEALDAHRRNETLNALVAYKNSFKVLEDELVPAASSLNEISDAQLENAYETQVSHSKTMRTVILIFAFPLVALLLAIQYYVFKRFRRRISPGLVVATLATLLLVGYTVRAFRENAHDLHVLKHDAYESVDDLLATLANAYEANSAESRWLLDRGAAGEHEQRFNDYVAKLAKFKQGTVDGFERLRGVVLQRGTSTKARLEAGSDPVAAELESRAQWPIEFAEGSLVRALDNVTFPDPGEPELDEPTHAADTTRAYAIYYAKDARIRELEASGKHGEAVDFCIGRRPGQSNWAFDEFDKSLMKWIDINERWLATYRDRAFASVAKLPWLAPLLSLIIAAAIAFGLRPRLREYAR
jgi:CHASE3 domain sensor protein